MICPWCKTEFTPKQESKRFCCQEHKDSYWNWEKKNELRISASFRPVTEEYATALHKNVREMSDWIYAMGVKWMEQGKTIPEIFGETKEP